MTSVSLWAIFVFVGFPTYTLKLQLFVKTFPFLISDSIMNLIRWFFSSLFISRSIPVGRYYFFPRADVPGRSIFLLWRRSSMWRQTSSLSFMLTRMDSGGSSVSLLGSTPSRTGVVLDVFAVSAFLNLVCIWCADSLLYLEKERPPGSLQQTFCFSSIL